MFGYFFSPAVGCGSGLAVSLKMEKSNYSVDVCVRVCKCEGVCMDV